MNSWKTTSTGILTILGALVTLYFKRTALTPEVIMPAATAVLAGIGLILARDNDKPEDPKPVPVKSGPLMAIALSGALAALVFSPGCTAPPQRVAFNTAAAPVMTVDHAMQLWGDYVKQYHPPVAQERQVLAAYHKAKAAELSAIDAAQIAGDSLGATNLTATLTTQLQSSAASEALSDLLSLIQQFGVKL